MAATRRHASPLRVTEDLVRASFSEEAYANLAAADGERPDSLVVLQRQYRPIVVLAREQFEALKGRLTKWREQVQCGEVDFDQSREDCFRGELQAFTSLVDALDETFNRFHQARGVFLTNPRAVNVLVELKNVAKRMLDTWRSPEWEVRDERTVKWDKEQTEHLLAKLGSRK
jgi:hypothetical protein